MTLNPQAPQFDEGYNQRLFEKPGLRSYFHTARYHWVRQKIAKLNISTGRVFELGCFDGRLLEHLPRSPGEYLGLDADWEGGLSMALKRQHGPGIQFKKSTSPTDLNDLASTYYDLALALETMEHLEPSLVEEYIAQISRITRGYFLVTVPNEKGIAFLSKYIAKKYFLEGVQKYTAREVLFATLGMMGKVERDDHKGFDYGQLAKSISTHFTLESVEPIPWSAMPAAFGFSVGIVARRQP